jgi:hypothetical protein
MLVGQLRETLSPSMADSVTLANRTTLWLLHDRLLVGPPHRHHGG